MSRRCSSSRSGPNGSYPAVVGRRVDGCRFNEGPDVLPVKIEIGLFIGYRARSREGFGRFEALPPRNNDEVAQERLFRRRPRSGGGQRVAGDLSRKCGRAARGQGANRSIRLPRRRTAAQLFGSDAHLQSHRRIRSGFKKSNSTQIRGRDHV